MTRRISVCQTICKLNQRWKSTSSVESNTAGVESWQRGKQWQDRTEGSDRLDEKDIRKSFAPWIRIGEYEKGLLSHHSNFDLLRALFVLRICSIDSLVERSPKLFELSVKLGPLATWPMRKTFFNQFVGGEDIPRITTVVRGLQNRAVRLMVAPVLEEDIGDVKSSKTTYDNNINSLLELANMTSSLEKSDPILQLKVSAITPPNTLEEISEAIVSRCTDAQKLAKTVEEIANTIDNPSAFSLNVSKEDQVYFIDGLRRADQLAKQAQTQNLYITVDAEYFSCKPAISMVALALMARYNRKNGHSIGNTIQAYLKDAVPTISTELEVITKLIGVNWYGKVVRGAYMDKERQVAQAQGYSSPICDSYEDTNNSYNAVVNIILSQIRAAEGKHPKPYLLVASHNEKSIRLAAQRMEDLNLSREDGSVSFAQIFGMADYLSTPLVEKNYTVYKSTPYGPLEKVMPYLTRRALENRAVIQGAREERNMLGKELKYRINSLLKIG